MGVVKGKPTKVEPVAKAAEAEDAAVASEPEQEGDATSEPDATPEQKLADFAKAKDAKAAAAKAKKPRADGLSDLPPLPRAKKAKPPKPCACGCGKMTRGGEYLPGHDGRPKGWALRVERGIIKLADIPDGERQVVAKLLKERKAAEAITKE